MRSVFAEQFVFWTAITKILLIICWKLTRSRISSVRASKIFLHAIFLMVMGSICSNILNTFLTDDFRPAIQKEKDCYGWRGTFMLAKLPKLICILKSAVNTACLFLSYPIIMPTFSNSVDARLAKTAAKNIVSFPVFECLCWLEFAPVKFNVCSLNKGLSLSDLCFSCFCRCLFSLCTNSVFHSDETGGFGPHWGACLLSLRWY